MADAGTTLDDRTARLQVAAARQEESGQGIARLPRSAMAALGITEGDVVEIEGKRATAARAILAYPEDEGLEVIRLDGLQRANAEVGPGDHVTVRRVEPRAAQRVVFAPAQREMRLQGPGEALKRSFFGRPLVAGDIVATTGQQQLLIRSALRQLVILLNADAAGLYLVTQTGGLQLNASFGIPRWLVAQLSQHPPIESVMRAVAAQRREVIDTDPRRFPGPAFEGQQVAVPLHWNDALLGAVFVVSGRDRSFFPSEIQMIETGAFFLGIIAGQQRLIETLECRLSQVRRLSTVDETEGDTRGD